MRILLFLSIFASLTSILLAQEDVDRFGVVVVEEPLRLNANMMIPEAWQAKEGIPPRYEFRISATTRQIQTCPVMDRNNPDTQIATIIREKHTATIRLIDLIDGSEIARTQYQGQDPRLCGLETVLVTRPDEVIVFSGLLDIGNDLADWLLEVRPLMEFPGILFGHTEEIRYVAYSPDGRRVATAGDDSTLRVWDVDTDQELQNIRTSIHGDSLRKIGFSPDGTRLVVTARQEIQVWDSNSGAMVAGLVTDGCSRLTSVIYPSGNLQALVGERCSPERIENKDVETLSIPEALLDSAAAPHPDGTKFITAAGIPFSTESRLAMFDADSGVLLDEFQSEISYIPALEFSPDGQQILLTTKRINKSGERMGEDGIQLWDMTTNEPLFTIPIDQLETATYSPDGQSILTLSRGNLVQIFNAQSGALEHLLTIPGNGRVNAIASSPDGQFLLTGNHQGVGQIFRLSELTDSSSPSEATTVPDTSASVGACNVQATGNVNLRGGPGTSFDVVGTLSRGQSAVVTGQTHASDGFVWWQLNESNWVRSDVVNEVGDCENTPAIQN